MSLAELALDALVFLLASPALEPGRLLASHFPCVFSTASNTDKLLNQNTNKSFNFIS